MIRHADLDELDEERRAEIARLFERNSEIADLPEDLAQVRAWDELIEDCERAGFPHLIASALHGQYSTLAQGGMITDAVDVYLRLMQHLHRYDEYIHEQNVHTMLDSVSTMVMTALDDPAIPLERVTRIIDLVETSLRAHAWKTGGVHVARAAVAEARGDAAGTLDAVARLRAEGDDRWEALDLGIIQIEIPFLARFDLPRAVDTLDQRLGSLGIDVTELGGDIAVVRERAQVLALWAYLALRSGRIADAEAIADALVARLGADTIARNVTAEYAIRLLEHRPDDAAVVVDHALANLSLDHSDREVVAAAARVRILADPDGDEGRMLRALADDAARAHDARGGTTMHSRVLDELWWAGLPDEVLPAVVGDPAVWGDVGERAEEILAAGWLRRRATVRADEIPFAIKDRYSELLMASLEIVETDDPDTLVAQLQARAERLRSAVTLFTIPLLQCLRAGSEGDTPTMVTEYERAQQVLAQTPDSVADFLSGTADDAFLAIVKMAVATPGVPWEQLNRVVATEAQVRSQAGRAMSPVLLAYAELSAYAGDAETLRKVVGELDERLRVEREQVDEVELRLEVLRLVQPYAPSLAQSIGEWAREAGAAEQIREATAWLLWMRVAEGDAAAARELYALWESVDGDVELFGSLPGWVLLDGILPSGAEMVPVVDAVLASLDPVSPSDLEVLAAAAHALLATAPDDPRGEELHGQALETARGLDDRDGRLHAVPRIRDRWFGGGAQG